MSELLDRELAALETAADGSAADLVQAVAERRPRLLSSLEFLAALVDPGRFSRNQAIDICGVLMKLDPQFDVRLARLAPGRGQQECTLDTGSMLRLLDVLNVVSTGLRLALVLNHLTSHSNPQIASKAALFMGRRIENAAWVERQLMSSDARLRANLIEALWGKREAWARRMVSGALRDENNRVAGNALLGLWFLGDPNFPEMAGRMLRDARPAFRQTAAWVMGRSGDSGFTDVLREALSDPSPDVRRSATRALAAIRRSGMKDEAASLALAGTATDLRPSVQ